MMTDMNFSVMHEKLNKELRRGILVLATLSQLKEAKYGYALIDELSKRGLEIDQGTLYPQLRRLEEQGLLDSEWIVEGSRPRRYYQINSTGEDLLQVLTDDWLALVNVMKDLLLPEKE